MASFNLLDKDWIPIVRKDGSTCEVSILTLLSEAGTIRRISGNPLEAATILRLVLAAAHRVNSPEGEFDWADLWKDRVSYLQAVSRYLEEQRDLFDLYDETRPFGQTTAIACGTTTPAVVVYEHAQGNNPVFLDHSVVSKAVPLPSPKAARSLLVTHAYGGSGTGGNNPLNGNKKDQMLAGPLCARLIAVVEGSDLEQTILLNLGSNLRAGLPSWEQPEVTRPESVAMNGVADLYTRNTRAVRLTPSEDGTQCIGVALYQGRALSEGSADPMIPRYLAQDKKFKDLRLNPERSAWRDADVILSTSPSHTDRPVRALEQLQQLVPAVVPNERFSLQILGVAANAQGPVTRLWRDERLPIDTSVIGDDQKISDLQGAIRSAEEQASETRKRISSFAYRYLQDGAQAKPDDAEVRKLADELSPELQDYWAMLAPMGERIACADFDENRWANLLKKASEDAFNKAVTRLPADARRFRAQYARTSDKEKAAV